MLDHNPESAERILRAAIDLFSRKGLEATSVREIVEAAHVAKPALYYYYGSKEGICEAAFTRIADVIANRTDAALAGPSGGREQLADVVWGIFDLRSEYPELSRLAVALVYGPEPELAGQAARNMAERLDRCFRRAASRACASGLICESAEPRLAMGLRSAVWARVIVPAYRKTPKLTRETARQIVDDLLDGLGVKQGQETVEQPAG